MKPYFRRRTRHPTGYLAQGQWELIDRATGRVMGVIERESYPTCRGGSEVVAWTATDPSGRRHLTSRLGDAILALATSSVGALACTASLLVCA